MAPSFRLPRRTSLIEFLILLTLALTLFYFLLLPGFHEPHSPGSSSPRRKSPQTPLPCSRLPGAEDTLVVLKTSATEIEARLPVHFDTTLLCSPNYLIFSDYAENYAGYPVHDALASVDRSLRTSHPDFELWRRLKKSGPDALEDEEIWDSETTVRDLDKWKYLPMLERTFAEFPEKKWYVLLETETFLFWATLLRYVGELDHTRKWYLGAEEPQGERVFAAKGAGILLSRAAVEAVVRLYRETRAAWEAFTETQDAGDVVLAEVEYGLVHEGRRLWCSPTISYAGVEKGNIEEMWKFEQEWMKENPDQPLLHQHIFTSFILPRLIVRSGRVDDWDNLSNDSSSPAGDVDECRGICMDDPECAQYSFTDGRCMFSRTPKLGAFTRGVESRWLLARVKRWGEEMGECSGVQGWLD